MAEGFGTGFEGNRGTSLTTGFEDVVVEVEGKGFVSS
jgi:hypothetical protein